MVYIYIQQVLCLEAQWSHCDDKIDWIYRDKSIRENFKIELISILKLIYRCKQNILPN